MLYFDGFVGLVTLGLWIFCLVDVIVTDEASCRNLPKLPWLLLVLLIPLVGSIVWLIAGRPQRAPGAPTGRYERQAPGFPSTTGRAGSPRRARRTTRNSSAGAVSGPRRSGARPPKSATRTDPSASVARRFSTALGPALVPALRCFCQHDGTISLF